MQLTFNRAEAQYIIICRYYKLLHIQMFMELFLRNDIYGPFFFLSDFAQIKNLVQRCYLALQTKRQNFAEIY